MCDHLVFLLSSPVIEAKNISLIVQMNAECVVVMNVSRGAVCVSEHVCVFAPTQQLSWPQFFSDV